MVIIKLWCFKNSKIVYEQNVFLSQEWQYVTVRLEFENYVLWNESYRTSVTYLNLIIEAYRTYKPYL